MTRFALEELVRGDVDQAGRLADALARGEDADIPFPQPARDRLFEDPQGAALDEFFLDRERHVLSFRSFGAPVLCLSRYCSMSSSATCGRHPAVLQELHGELGLALGQRAQDRRVAEHLAQRHLGVDPGERPVLDRADDDAPPLVDRGEDVAGELGRALDRDLHDRLEDLRLGLRVDLPEGAHGRPPGRRCRTSRRGGTGRRRGRPGRR